MSPAGARARHRAVPLTAPQTGPGRLTRPRLYEQLADHIADFIDAQGLTPGDRLPPERALAKDLGVSRATLSRALVALEVRGRVEVRHGDGAVVRDPAAGAALPLLDGAGPDELRRARSATMAGLARTAARHPDSSLRTALLGDDGTVRSFDDVWACVLRLVPGDSLLGEMDHALAARLADIGASSPDPAAVARLAAAVRAGRDDLVPAACDAVLGLTTP